MSNEATTPTPNPRKFLMFVGVRADASAKLFAAYIELSQADIDARTLPDAPQAWYDAKSKGQKSNMMGSEGMIYSVEYDAASPGTIYPGSAQFRGRWPDRAQVVKWTAENDAAEAVREAKKARTEDTRFNAVRDDLKNIRAAYQALPYPHRPFFLAQVVDYLNRV